MYLQLAPPPPIVHLLDADPDHREHLGQMLATMAIRLHTYPCAESFLARNPTQLSGCLVATAQLPGMSAVELTHHLKSERRDLPSLLVIDPGEVSMAVSALKAGVREVMEKPVAGPLLLDRVHRLLWNIGLIPGLRTDFERCAAADGGA